MTGKSHQIIGLTAGLTTYLYLAPHTYGPATFAAVLVTCSLAALLPDIDQPSARIWEKLPFGRAMGEMVNPFLQHRNLTHSFIGVAIVGFILRYLLLKAPIYWGLVPHEIWIASMVSYCSHILADMVTVEGVPLFFPNQRMLGIPPRPFQGIRIITGGWFENLIVFPVANAAFITILIVQWPHITSILFK